MNDGPQTTRSVDGADSSSGRLLHWVLLAGNRLLVAGGIVTAVFAAFLVLVAVDIVAIGGDSSAATVFGSGLVSGTLTVVTIALSINQLVLSRVFGSPNQLRDRLDGTRELRRRVQDCAGVAAAPNDPAAFLSLIATTLAVRAQQFGAALGDAACPETERYAADVAAYAERLDDRVDGEMSIVDVLDALLGTGYAQNMAATEYVRNEYTADLSGDARAELDAIDDLLEAIAISRQFFKTISLQQDFARLARILVYSGVVALVVSLALAFSYRSSTVTLGPSYRWLVVPLGVAVVVTPLAVFVSYILRAATIARRTVSVGPFVPPGEE